MSSIDPKQAERVWSRVMGAPCPPPCTSTPPAPQPRVLDEQTLCELLQSALCAQATYCQLARMARGCARKTLQAIAAGSQRHVRMLSALYYIQTGRKACPDPARPACVACLNEALRAQHAAELQASRRYHDLAGQAGEHACIFEQLSTGACCHAQMLYQLLQHCL